MDNIRSSDDSVDVEVGNGKVFKMQMEDTEAFGNIWVSNHVDISLDHGNRFFNRIVYCISVRVLPTPDRVFSVNEYPFLKPQNAIRMWDSYDATVVGEDGDPISLEELLTYLPNATDIRYLFCIKYLHIRNTFNLVPKLTISCLRRHQKCFQILVNENSRLSPLHNAISNYRKSKSRNFIFFLSTTKLKLATLLILSKFVCFCLGMHLAKRLI